MLKIGCCKVDITPEIPVYLRGYAGRNELSNAIDDRLSAGVMLLAQGRTKILLLTLDNLGIGINQCEKIYADLKKACGLRPEQIYLACSHTHFAPGLDDYTVMWPGGKMPTGRYPAEKEYYPAFISAIIGGVREAEANLEQVVLEETTTQIPGVLFNRRTINVSDGLVTTNYVFPENPDDYIFQPTDPELALWRFRKKDGSLKAIIGRFSCHPVTGGSNDYGISADYPGYFQAIIQREFNCPGFFLLGNAGDTVPLQRFGDTRRDIAEILVRSIKMAERTFRKAGEFKLAEKVIPFNVTLQVKFPRNQAEKHLKQVLKKYDINNFDFEKCILGVYEAEFAMTYPQDKVELPMHLLRLGSKVLVGLPFEVLTEIGVRLRKACPNTVLTAITGGYEGYLPLAKEFPLGGYEVTLGARFQKRAGNEILAAAIKAVREF